MKVCYGQLLLGGKLLHLCSEGEAAQKRYIGQGRL
jgi:hypothetical protein